jgi:hypothetical protein
MTANAADFPFERNAGGFGDPAADFLAQPLQVGGAGVAGIDQEVAMDLGHHGAADLEGLGEEVRRRVAETCGVTLEWEIRRIGIPATGTPAEVAP